MRTSDTHAGTKIHHQDQDMTLSNLSEINATSKMRGLLPKDNTSWLFVFDWFYFVDVVEYFLVIYISTLWLKHASFWVAPTGTPQYSVTFQKSLYVSSHAIGVRFIGIKANVKGRDRLMPFAFYNEFNSIGTFLTSSDIETGNRQGYVDFSFVIVF